MKRIRLFGIALTAVAAVAGVAVVRAMDYSLPPETADFRPAAGAGFDAAQNNCRACHSADYIETQPPNKGKPFWEAEVKKMVNVYKAQISPEDAAVIADYLAEKY